MPTSLEIMSSTFAPPLTRLEPRGALSIGDELPQTQVMTSAELRALAAQWRAMQAPDDLVRAERIARALEWLADYREPSPKTRLEELGDRLSGWMGL